MAAYTWIKLPNWYRALAVIVGVCSIVLALLVLVEPSLVLWLLILFLALALLLMGIDRLVAGVTGHSFGQGMSLLPPIAAASRSAPPNAPTGVDRKN